MSKLSLMVALVLAQLAGCAGPTPPVPAAATVLPAGAQAPPLARFRCDDGIAFTVRFDNDAAMVDAGPRGSDVLLRDAGGATPQQTVYSNARMRAEFGLGVSGREARLRYPLAPLVAHCIQE